MLHTVPSTQSRCFRFLATAASAAQGFPRFTVSDNSAALRAHHQWKTGSDSATSLELSSSLSLLYMLQVAYSLACGVPLSPITSIADGRWRRSS